MNKGHFGLSGGRGTGDSRRRRPSIKRPRLNNRVSSDHSWPLGSRTFCPGGRRDGLSEGKDHVKLLSLLKGLRA